MAEMAEVEKLIEKANALTACPVVVIPTIYLREWRTKLSLSGWALLMTFVDRCYGWPRARSLRAQEARLLSNLDVEQFGEALRELVEKGLLETDGTHYWMAGEKVRVEDAVPASEWQVDWRGLSEMAARVRRARKRTARKEGEADEQDA